MPKYAVYLISHTRQRPAALIYTVFPRILLALASSMFMCFVVLSGSRTTQLVTIIISAWMAFYTTMSKSKKYNIKQIAFSVIACLLSVLVYVGAFAAVKNLLPHVKIAARKAVTFKVGSKLKDAVNA